MPIRNPFARRPGPGVVVQDENARPTDGRVPSAPGFERVDTVGSKASSVLSIRNNSDNGDYKMSVVNDSGVYLPPSPTEEKELWPKKLVSSGRDSARNSTDTRTSIGDIEHFSISRESFDSYRRSFDISARSPIAKHDVPARQSLDSARFHRHPRAYLDRKHVEPQHPTVEESGFEDVGLNDEQSNKQQQRKRGLFSRFGDNASDSQNNQNSTTANGGGTAPTNAVSRFLLPGRKRGQSGQGSELGNMERPKTATSTSEAQNVY